MDGLFAGRYRESNLQFVWSENDWAGNIDLERERLNDHNGWHMKTQLPRFGMVMRYQSTISIDEFIEMHSVLNSS